MDGFWQRKFPTLKTKIKPQFMLISRNGGEKEMVGIKMYAKIQELKTKGYKKQRAARELDIRPPRKLFYH